MARRRKKKFAKNCPLDIGLNPEGALIVAVYLRAHRSSRARSKGIRWDAEQFFRLQGLDPEAIRAGHKV